MSAAAMIDPIQERIDQDLAKHREALDRLVESEALLVKKYTAARDQQDKLWAKVEKSSKSGRIDDAKPELVEAAVAHDKVVDKLTSEWTKAQVATGQTRKLIMACESGEEYKRRQDVAKSLQKLRASTGKTQAEPRRSAKKSVHADRTPPPDVYLNKETGRFIPGYDMKYKGDLKAAARGEKKPGALAKFTKADAENRLREMGLMP